MSVHAPPQIAPPAPAQSVHVPWEQYGVDPPQALPHAPQWLAFHVRSTHCPSHSAPPGQQELHSPWLQ
jgi:hypothetical protein